MCIAAPPCQKLSKRCLLALQPHQQPLHSSWSMGSLAHCPAPGQYRAKQKASVLAWTEVSSLRHFHNTRRGIPTFTKSNPFSDEGMKISMVLLTHHIVHPHPHPTTAGHFLLAIAPSASVSNPLPLPFQGKTSHAFPSQTPHSPKPSPKGFLLHGGCALATPQALSHLPDMIQELRGREALLRTGKLLAVVLEKGQQVRVQVKQPATAREKPTSSHFLSFIPSHTCNLSSVSLPTY